MSLPKPWPSIPAGGVEEQPCEQGQPGGTALSYHTQGLTPATPSPPNLGHFSETNLSTSCLFIPGQNPVMTSPVSAFKVPRALAHLQFRDMCPNPPSMYTVTVKTHVEYTRPDWMTELHRSSSPGCREHPGTEPGTRNMLSNVR